MKKYLCLLMSFAFVSIVQSQSAIEKDGLYYDGNDQLFTGELISMLDNGQIEKSANITRGYLDGPVSFYSENGELEETGFYTMGKKTGTWVQYAAGKKIGEAFYKDGLKDGIWTVWDNNGVKRYHMVYSQGKKIDTWKMWDENSTLVSERTYPQ